MVILTAKAGLLRPHRLAIQVAVMVGEDMKCFI